MKIPMTDILQLIANERRGIGMGGEGDFRPLIVAGVQRIASTHGRRVNHRIAKDAKRLQASLKASAPNHELIAVLSGLIEDVPATGKITTQRKRVAAEVACDLLLNYGGGPVTSTRGGSYLRLATLLYATASGGSGNLEAVCAAHLQSIGLSADRGVKRKPPAEIAAMMAADAESERQRRRIINAAWKPQPL